MSGTVQDALKALMSAACEVCGARARHAVADTREGPPVEVRGEDGPERWPTFEVVGTHYFCDAHRREPVRQAAA